jgi:hypothetical protein
MLRPRCWDGTLPCSDARSPPARRPLHELDQSAVGKLSHVVADDAERRIQQLCQVRWARRLLLEMSEYLQAQRVRESARDARIGDVCMRFQEFVPWPCELSGGSRKPYWLARDVDASKSSLRSSGFIFRTARDRVLSASVELAADRAPSVTGGKRGSAHC